MILNVNASNRLARLKRSKSIMLDHNSTNRAWVLYMKHTKSWRPGGTQMLRRALRVGSSTITSIRIGGR